MSSELEKEYLEALKIHQAEYLNSVWKTLAALMVANGWILSSDKTRCFIGSSNVLKIVFTVVIVLTAGMHWLTLNDLLKNQRK